MGNEGAVNKISSFLVRGQCPYKPPVEYSVDRITYIHVRTHKASYTHTHTHTWLVSGVLQDRIMAR